MSSPSRPLGPEHGAALLAVARQAIAGALGRAHPAAASGDDEAWLDAPGAVFVTLTQDDELRGCIGSLEARRSLREDVADNAVASALRDPRFPPLSPDELEVTSIEVSVLTRPLPLAVSDEADARARLRPGIDGVIFAAGPHRATFLPQVWDDLPDPADFLAHLVRKAGLRPGAPWPAGTRLSTYQVTKFAEQDPAKDVR